MARRRVPQPWRAATPSWTSAPLDARNATRGTRSCSAGGPASATDVPVVLRRARPGGPWRRSRTPRRRGGRRSATGGRDHTWDAGAEGRWRSNRGAIPRCDSSAPKSVTAAALVAQRGAGWMPGCSGRRARPRRAGCLADGPRRRRQQAAAPSWRGPPSTRASPSTGHVSSRRPPPAGAALAGNNRGAEPLERQRGEQPHAVDLGLRFELDAGVGAPRGRARSRNAGALRLEQQRFAGELGEGDVLAVVERWPRGATRSRSSSNSGSVSTSGSSTGTLMTARSSRPVVSWGSSEVVVASTTITRTLGCLAAMRLDEAGHEPARGGADDADAHAAADLVVEAGQVGVMASSSDWMRRARRATTSPSSVRAPELRSISVTPTSVSSRATWVETLDWTVCRARAAAENEPWSATASRAFSWRRSILRGYLFL